MLYNVPYYGPANFHSVKRRRYDVDADVTENHRQSNNRCLDNLLASTSPTSSGQAESAESSPSSQHGSHISEPVIPSNSLSPNSVSCSMANSEVVDSSVFNSAATDANNSTSPPWLTGSNGDVKQETSVINANNSTSGDSTGHESPNQQIYQHHTTNSADSLASYQTAGEDIISKTSDYSNSQQHPITATFYNNQMQVYQTVSASTNSATAYSMTSPNSTTANYYNGQTTQPTSGYGVLSNAYAMSGSRMLNQAGRNGQGLTSQTGYLNPYGTAFGSASSGQVSGQTGSTYSTYGTGYNSMSSSSYSGAAIPNAQSFNSTQQGLDYAAFGGFGQTGTYSYPCYPTGQGYSSPYVAGSTSSIQPVSSNTTYQLAQVPPAVSDGITDQHHHYPLDDYSAPHIKSETNKSSSRKRSGRGPGRKTANPSPEPENQLERVYLWDLDETLIIYNSLVTGSYATKYGKDERLASALGVRMEELVFKLADSKLFYNDLEVGTPECDQSHIDDVSSDDNGQDLSSYNFQADGFHAAVRDANFCLSATVRGGVDCNRKLAFRYRKIKEIYNKYRSDISELLGPANKEHYIHLRSQIEDLTDNWASLALKCLNIIDSRPSCVNVLVTTAQLVPAIAKVLLYGLGPVFPVENIYSATKLGKEDCFQKIRLRFGKCTYVALGDGIDERSAAKNLDFPFWPISTHSDFAALHDALVKEHM